MRPAAALRTTVVLAALSFGGAASPLRTAAAHFLQFPKVDLVRIERDGLRIEVRYSVPDGVRALDLRQRHDRDGNGLLDDGEQGTLAIAVGAEAVSSLIVLLDGEALSMKGPDVALRDLVPEVHTARAVEATIRLSADLPLAPGEHFLSLTDRGPDDRGLVPVRITPGEGILLGSLPSQLALGGGPIAAGTFRVEAGSP